MKILTFPVENTIDMMGRRGCRALEKRPGNPINP
jgi:hypothetical protein